MVARKSSKTTKFSYTERVLGAFTQVRRERRQQTVHIATLRAQVKKIAQSKKDKLGPRWSSWVGKTIHKLADEGILTLSGNRIIAAARQSLSTAAHDTSSTIQRVSSSRHTTQRPSRRGIKRTRRTHTPPLSVEQSEGEEEASNQKIKRVKYARNSTQSDLPVKKPVDKMSKAELIAELHTLQQAHEEAIWRATSPLTDIDQSEEIMELREKLQQKEVDIANFRRELEEAKEHTLAIHDGTPNRFSIPEAAIGYVPSSPTIPVLTMPIHPLGDVRTQPEIPISELSKQLTPAPSPQNATLHEHAFDNVSNGAEGLGSSFLQGAIDNSPFITRHNTPTIPHTSVTKNPIFTPRMIDLCIPEFLQTQFLQLKADYSRVAEDLMDRDNRVSSLQTDIVYLQEQILDHASAKLFGNTEHFDLETMKVKLNALFLSQVEAIKRTVQLRDGSILRLETEKKKYQVQLSTVQQQTLSNTENSVTVQAATAKNFAHANADSQTEAETTQLLSGNLGDHQMLAEYEKIIEDYQASKDTLLRVLEEATIENSSKSQQLQDVETSNESLLSQLTSATDKISTLQGALENSVADGEATAVRLTASLSKARGDATVLQEKVTSLEKELDTSNYTITALQAQLASIMHDRTDLSLQLEKVQAAAATNVQNAVAAMKVTLDTTLAELGKEKDEKVRVAEILATKESEIREYVQILSMAESIVEKFRGDARKSESTTASLRSQLLVEATTIVDPDPLSGTGASHDLVFAKQRSVISDLENVLQSTLTEIEGLAQELQLARTASSELQSHLKARSIDLADIRVKLEEEIKRSSVLQSDLAAAVGKVQDTEDEITELKISKQADEETIENLKGMFSTLRDSQMRSLAELDNQVVSAHSSPVPERRSKGASRNRTVALPKLTL